MVNDDFIAELWTYADEVRMRDHPWFAGIVSHRWTHEEIIIGEVQHYLRVRTNPIYFGYMAINAIADKSYAFMDTVLENFLEELGGERSHVDIVLQFLEEGGITREQADEAEAAPGTMAAIEMITSHCQRRSALEGIAMLAFVESMHGGPDGAAAGAYRELTGYYGFSEHAAETYKIHAVQDVSHGGQQIELLRHHAVDEPTRDRIRRAVKLGLTAYTLEWDGHVQAITGQREFWRGNGPLHLQLPEVRLRRTGDGRPATGASVR